MHEHIPYLLFCGFAFVKPHREHVELDIALYYAVGNFFYSDLGAAHVRVVCEAKNQYFLHSSIVNCSGRIEFLAYCAACSRIYHSAEMPRSRSPNPPSAHAHEPCG